MLDFPHHYAVTVAAALQGDVILRAPRLPDLRSASPAEFDGPGDRWSPETLLVAAVGDCFVLTFRAVARASRLPWISLQCRVTGTLDRVERVTQFTHLNISAHLMLLEGTDVEHGRRCLEKAERGCLISNSLKAAIHLEPEIEVEVNTADVLAAPASHS